MRQPARSILRSVSATAIANYGISAFGMLNGILLARTLSPSQRGELALAVLWPSVTAMFAELGLGFAFAYYAGRGERTNAIWTFSLMFSVAVGGMVTLLSMLLPRTLHMAFWSGAISLGMTTIPFNLFSSYQAQILLGCGFIQEQARIRLVISAVYFGGVVLCAVSGRSSVLYYTFAFVASHCCAAVVAWRWTQRRIEPRFEVDWSLLPALCRYGIKTYVASVAGQASLRLDQMLVGAFLTRAEMGYYAAASSFAGILMPAYTAAAAVAFPMAIRNGGLSAGLAQVRRGIGRIGFGTALVVGLLILATPTVFPMLFGKAYAVAAVPAQILLAASVFQGVNGILSNVLRGAGRPGLPACAEALGMAVTIVLLWLLLPTWRINGAAITSVIAYGVVAAILVAFLSHSHQREVVRVGGPELSAVD